VNQRRVSGAREGIDDWRPAADQPAVSTKTTASSLADRKDNLMGDRTNVDIEVLASARTSVEEAFCQNPDEHYEGDIPGTVRLTFYEVNGGGFDLLVELARSGLVFRGSHDDGCNYCGMTFAAYDGLLAEVASPQGEVMVRIDRQTCEVDPNDLAAIRTWREVDDKVLAFLNSGGPPVTQPPPARSRCEQPEDLP
jgi:hypothetical protein